MRASDRYPTLRAQLIQHYLPVLFASGFTGPAKLPLKKLHFHYERIEGDARQRLTLEFHRRSPRFAVLLAVLPMGGVGELYSQGGTLVVGWLKPRPGRFAGRWFTSELPWLKQWLGGDGAGRARRAVDQCLGLWPEVEAWWTKRASTPHIRVRRVAYRARGRG